jgi:uncharacterized coiled-coil protein SlyX
MENDEAERRIVELELRYMRMDKMMQDLSDVLVAQQSTIERMTAELEQLRERIPDDPTQTIRDEPPPHY